MSAPLSSDLQRRKKEVVMVEGYEIDCATEVTGTTDATQDILHVYGDDDAIMDINVNSSALTLTVYDKVGNNDILDALQRMDPDDPGDKEYNWNNIYPTSVWVNRKNTDNDRYTRGFFYKNWLPTPASPAGDAAAKGTRTFSGNSEVLMEYNEPIIGEKIALTSGAGGYTGTISYTPLTIPGSSPALYAIRVVAIEEARTGDAISSYEEEDLEVTSTMVTSAKAVVIATTDMKILDGPSHAYVNYLYSAGTGIYPAIKGTYPGKFDDTT
jgi:hypothetical protein